MRGRSRETLLWLWDTCGSCGGHGIVADYGHGTDFYGPKDCPDCVAGRIVVYRNDAVALWPGGPLAGSYPGRYGVLRRRARQVSG